MEGRISVPAAKPDGVVADAFGVPDDLRALPAPGALPVRRDGATHGVRDGHAVSAVQGQRLGVQLQSGRLIAQVALHRRPQATQPANDNDDGRHVNARVSI
eukprot:8176720-Pyramimonas_sp.AAC.1